MRLTSCLALTALTSCHYAGPLAGGGSEIRAGTLPDRVARLLHEAGGSRPPEFVLPPSVNDSTAIYLVAVDQRALGVATAQVAVLPRNDSTPKYPRDGWQPVDSFGVYSRRFAPGEYVVFVQDRRHWAARKIIQLHPGRIDTLLAVLRSGMQQGDRAFHAIP